MQVTGPSPLPPPPGSSSSVQRRPAGTAPVRASGRPRRRDRRRGRPRRAGARGRATAGSTVVARGSGRTAGQGQRHRIPRAGGREDGPERGAATASPTDTRAEAPGPPARTSRERLRGGCGGRARGYVYHPDRCCRVCTTWEAPGPEGEARDDRAIGCPHFVIAGAPKAGTTALHAALATHPELYLSPVKEPKYFLCDGRPPRARPARPGRRAQRPGVDLAAGRVPGAVRRAPPGTVRGESTPFYLYDLAAHARLAADVPDIKLIAVVRDPVDRAYSNWAHLRSDGLEPEADFLAAVRAGGAADRRRLGAVLALPRARPLRRAAARPVPALARGSRSSCCATGSWSTRPRRRWTGSARSSASPPGWRTPSPPRT